MEHVCFDTRRHGVVLVPALARAFVLALPGGFLVTRASPLPVVGALLTALAALIALRAVWKWERTRVVVTTEQLVLVQGTLRRRTAAVRLDRVGPVEVEQTLLGRLLGYGTLIAGSLEIDRVPEPRQVYGFVQRAGA